MDEKTVASGTVRVLMDAAEQVIGTNGLKSLLNYAMMPQLMNEKPGYGFEKAYTDIEYSRIIVSFYELLGVSGAKAIFRIIGKLIAVRVKDLGLLDQFKDLPGQEKLFKAVEIYAMVSGRGTVTIQGDKVVFDNTLCTTCFNLRSDVPICTVINGFLDELAAWAGFKGARSIETKCKAMGDDTCLYEIVTGQ
jgi:predicted hydrocarbon binding protein